MPIPAESVDAADARAQSLQIALTMVDAALQPERDRKTASAAAVEKARRIIRGALKGLPPLTP